MVARSAVSAAIALTCLLTPALATAELARGAASVREDALSMKGTVASQQVGPATRHDITRVNGGSVREFTNANGQVFAVTWNGPGKPDLRSLLGPYFAALQGAQASQGRMMHSLRRPAAVNQKDLKIEMAGHMGWFHGMAYIPSLTPAGFSLDELDPTR
jgi:hypothetical protein